MNDLIKRPAQVCQALLAALDAADGLTHNRKRDQTPAGVGLAIKRDLLQRAIQHDPDPDAFEAWLLQCSPISPTASPGAVAAMARAIFDEWRLSHSLHDFQNWLDQGAPSADADDGKRKHSMPSHSNAND